MGLLKRILDRSPIVTRRRMQHELARQHRRDTDLYLEQLRDQRRKHEVDLNQIRARVKRIAEAFTRTDYQRGPEPGRYTLTVEFDTRINRLTQCGDLALLARMVGEKVEHEIARSKFVQHARDNERRRHEERVRKSPYVREFVQGTVCKPNEQT